MPILPFAEWLPDQPAGAVNIRNVVPRSDKSYGPMPSPNPSTGPLPLRCFGSLTLMNASREVWAFAATRTRIHRLLRSASEEWVDVAKPGGYHTLTFDQGGSWDSTAFGNRVIFTNYIDPVQSYLVGSGDPTFADLSATAPKARFCCTIRDFLFLGATNDPIDGEQPRRAWWSSIGDPTDWPDPYSDLAVMRQSSFQDLAQSELGFLTGMVGGNLSGADGGIFFERGVIRVSYVGSPAIWDFAVSEGASGTDAPWSIVSRRMPSPSGTRAVAYYWGADGIHAWDGSAAIPIGAQKFDRWVYDDLQTARRTQVVGVAAPNAHLILWAYHNKDAVGDLYNRLLVYNYQLGRAVVSTLAPFEWLQDNIAGSLSIDDLDPYGPLDTLTPSFDSMSWLSTAPIVGVFDEQHRFCDLSGPPLQAVVETDEISAPGRRTKLHGTVRPLVEGVGGNSAMISVGTRERTMNRAVYGAEVPVNILGNCGLRSTGHYVRLRVRLPARLDWQHLVGVEAEPKPEGRLR